MFKYHLAQSHMHLKSLLTAEPAPKVAQVITMSAITKMVTNQKTTVHKSVFSGQRCSQDWMMWQRTRLNFLSWLSWRQHQQVPNKEKLPFWSGAARAGTPIWSDSPGQDKRWQTWALLQLDEERREMDIADVKINQAAPQELNPS